MTKTAKAKVKKPEVTKLSSEDVLKIRTRIIELQEKKMERNDIRKTIFKEFKIDTTQWELNWEATQAPTKKGSAKNKRVDPDKSLVTTHDQKRTQEPVNYEHFFTDEELISRGDILARLEIDRMEIEENKKNVMSDFKSKLEEKDTAINKVSREIDSKKEQRNAICDVIRDFSKGTKQCFLNGKLVKEDKLSASEYQLKIPME